MELANVIPWGRSFNEYKAMFSLNDADFKKRILGCADGPACFNAELTKAKGHIVSIDPIYQFNSEQIRSRIKTVYPQVMSQVANNLDDFVWKMIANIDELGHVRMKAMEHFLNDFKQGKESGRYIDASLPELPFNDNEFDLALCSHYLFLYSEHIDQVQHILSMKELCRVAKEVRVYPLLALDGLKSKHLEPVRLSLMGHGYDLVIQKVEYQFQKGATEMLLVQK